jgi:hypothetical protein
MNSASGASRINREERRALVDKAMFFGFVLGVQFGAIAMWLATR